MSELTHAHSQVIQPGDTIPIPNYLPTLTYAMNEIIAYLKNFQKSVPKLIDIGCGTKSDIAQYLKEKNQAVILHGVDIDEQASANQDLERVFICSAEEMDKYVSETYNIVFSQYLLEHVRDSEKTLKAMSRLVAKQGILAIILPNPNAPESIVTKWTPYWFHVFFKRVIQNYENVEENTFPTCYSFNTLNNVENQLKIYGFNEVKTAYIPETYYRFRRRQILGKMSITYTKILSLLRLDRFQSSAVIIARKMSEK